MIRNIRGLHDSTESDHPIDDNEYETKVVLVGTSTVPDESFVETTTMTVIEKGKQQIAKIEDTIHVISDKTKGF